ncbi:MAG: YeeE/YedE family protein [Bacteroidales bacterium]|nr:YeeE/YedE family protein [Bacteroidales bacterium]
MKTKPFMNPYLAGFFLGLVLLTTIYITGRGLGASGAIKSVVVASVKMAAPQHYEDSRFYEEYDKSHPESPLRSWLVFEILGVILGAFLSGLISDRIVLKLEKGPGIRNGIRIIAAITGGLFFGFGALFARGCTSEAALSGMAVMSFGGILTMMVIFGSAYGLAYFARRLWLKR